MSCLEPNTVLDYSKLEQNYNIVKDRYILQVKNLVVNIFWNSPSTVLKINTCFNAFWQKKLK